MRTKHSNKLTVLAQYHHCVNVPGGVSIRLYRLVNDDGKAGFEIGFDTGDPASFGWHPVTGEELGNAVAGFLKQVGCGNVQVKEVK